MYNVSGQFAAGATKGGMKMKPIYIPKGKAKEYGDYAINIYTGCPHRCYYCFAPSVLRKDREQFHTNIKPRDGIVEATIKQLEREGITGKLIHLCFTCDPYPSGCDTRVTREIIKAIKSSGNHVQILTKGNGERDFDLLDENDWYGITLDGDAKNPNLPYVGKYGLSSLEEAKRRGIKTWVSFEPVLDHVNVLMLIKYGRKYFDKVKIGKLNYYSSDINWKQFGEEAEQLCKQLGIDYYIKESLRAEMVKPPKEEK